VQLPVVIVRAGATVPPDCFGRILVAHDGSVFSRAAAEFAFTYGAAAGSRIVVLHVLNEARVVTGTLVAPEARDAHAPGRVLEDRITAHIRSSFEPLATAHGLSFDVRVLASGDPSGTILEVARTDDIDLLVLGGENKMLEQPLFFGQGTASIVERAECTTAVVVPHLK